MGRVHTTVETDTLQVEDEQVGEIPPFSMTFKFTLTLTCLLTFK